MNEERTRDLPENRSFEERSLRGSMRWMRGFDAMDARFDSMEARVDAMEMRF